MTTTLRLAPWAAAIIPIVMWRTGASIASTPLFAAVVLLSLMFAFGLRNMRFHGVFAPWPASARELRQILRRDESLVHQEMTNTVVEMIENSTVHGATDAGSAKTVLDALDEEVIRSGVGMAIALGRLPGRIAFDEICELAPSGEVRASTLRRFSGLEMHIQRTRSQD